MHLWVPSVVELATRSLHSNQSDLLYSRFLRRALVGL